MLTAAIAANAFTAYQSFSTKEDVGRPKWSRTSSSCSMVGLSLKCQLRIAVAKVPRKAALHADNWIDGNLRGPAFFVGALGFRQFPFHAQLVERLSRRTNEAISGSQHRLAR